MITLFKNAFMLDCTGNEPIESGWLAVEDGIIVETGVGVPRGFKDTEIIDCKGNTLMPGLIDAHIHLNLFDDNLAEIPCIFRSKKPTIPQRTDHCSEPREPTMFTASPRVLFLTELLQPVFLPH